MSMQMIEKTVTFAGAMAFVDIQFDKPVRNVEAMLRGAGRLSAIKVIGNKVRLAASRRISDGAARSTVLVMAETVGE